MDRPIMRNPILENIFNKVASSYSSIGPQYFNYFGKRLIDAINIQEGACVLDVAFGRGASLFPAAEKIGISGKAVGIDFSEEMVKETQNDITRRNISNVNVVQMDAEKMNFENEAFDYVLCGLAIHFFSDYERALKEFHRVLKNEGIVGITVWKKRQENDWVIGNVLERVLYKYMLPLGTRNSTLANSIKPEFGDEKELNSILMTAGFKDIKLLTEQKTFFYKDFEEWWQEQWSHAGRTIFETVQMRRREDFEKFKAELSEEFKKEFGNNPIPFEGKVIVAVGRK